jgi:hypothetical protein
MRVRTALLNAHAFHFDRNWFLFLLLSVAMTLMLFLSPRAFVIGSPIIQVSRSHFPHVLLAIFSSNFTLGRLNMMASSILDSKRFDLRFLDVFVVFPPGHGPAPRRFRSLFAPCESDAFRGLCCRVDWAMRFFLEREVNWFFRAIDDGWFNPYNLHTFVQQLESFIDPDRHVVIKGIDNPLFTELWNTAYMQGGAPILMSRAAVQHALSTFSGVCGDPHWPADDTALTLIANRTFESSTAWGDVRFSGDIWCSSEMKFHEQWALHSPTHFRLFDTLCSSKSRYLQPLKVLVGSHTCGGNSAWRQLVEQASADWFPEDLMSEFTSREHYKFCKNNSQHRRLASTAYLQSVTPWLDIANPILNFSVADLWTWGFEHIPQLPWLPRRPHGLGLSHRH